MHGTVREKKMQGVRPLLHNFGVGGNEMCRNTQQKAGIGVKARRQTAGRRRGEATRQKISKAQMI